MFREVNERIEAALEEGPPSMFFEFVCECCVDGCTDTVSLTRSEYEEIRAHPARFAVVPGHVDPAAERVVAGGTDRYDVVEKLERTAEFAAHMDPRGRKRL
jgi:hypothetical protein